MFIYDVEIGTDINAGEDNILMEKHTFSCEQHMYDYLNYYGFDTKPLDRILELLWSYENKKGKPQKLYLHAPYDKHNNREYATISIH